MPCHWFWQSGYRSLIYNWQNKIHCIVLYSILVIVINNILCLLLLCISLQRQWTDYRCSLGSLGNSSTALGRCDLGGCNLGVTVGPSYSLAVWTSFGKSGHHLLIAQWKPQRRFWPERHLQGWKTNAWSSLGQIWQNECLFTNCRCSIVAPALLKGTHQSFYNWLATNSPGPW